MEAQQLIKLYGLVELQQLMLVRFVVNMFLLQWLLELHLAYLTQSSVRFDAKSLQLTITSIVNLYV
jgi:hypothetical protein